MGILSEVPLQKFQMATETLSLPDILYLQACNIFFLILSKLRMMPMSSFSLKLRRFTSSSPSKVIMKETIIGSSVSGSSTSPVFIFNLKKDVYFQRKIMALNQIDNLGKKWSGFFMLSAIISERFIWRILFTMECFGARNTVGFSSQIQQGRLPDQAHITYQGIFNQIKFDVGQKTELIKDLHFGYARYQFQESAYDSQINDYLALFVKGCKDGADRDERPLNSLICLDISGSMGGGLGLYNHGNFKSRLWLSVEAIKMFISKLRPTDSVGVITFNTQAQIILEPTYKSSLPENFFDRLDKIKANGGTTIKSGFETAVKLLKGFISENTVKDSENRIIMLTDVCDNSIQNQQKFLEGVSDSEGINLTIIGISNQFRSQVCECLKNVRGFNYFCAVSQDDIKKYVFETFDFGYFPSAYDIELSISSKDIKNFQVFGAPDADLVAQYNNGFLQQANEFTISKLRTTFPSELEIIDLKVFTFGGLILMKLKRKTQQPFFNAEVKLSYYDPNGKRYDQKYELKYKFPPHEQYFSEESLIEAIQAFVFTSEMKNILRQSLKFSDLSNIYDKYWPVLNALETIIPKSKIQDLKKVKKILSDSKSHRQAAKDHPQMY